MLGKWRLRVIASSITRIDSHFIRANSRESVRIRANPPARGSLLRGPCHPGLERPWIVKESLRRHSNAEPLHVAIQRVPMLSHYSAVRHSARLALTLELQRKSQR